MHGSGLTWNSRHPVSAARARGRQVLPAEAFISAEDKPPFGWPMTAAAPPGMFPGGGNELPASRAAGSTRNPSTSPGCSEGCISGRTSPPKKSFPPAVRNASVAAVRALQPYPEKSIVECLAPMPLVSGMRTGGFLIRDAILAAPTAVLAVAGFQAMMGGKVGAIPSGITFHPFSGDSRPP